MGIRVRNDPAADETTVTGLSVVNPVESGSGLATVASGLPLVVRVRFVVERPSETLRLRLALTAGRFPARTVWETHLNVSQARPRDDGAFELLYGVRRFNLLDEHGIALTARLVDGGQPLGEQRRLPLRILSLRTAGGGLVGLPNRVRIRSDDPNQWLKRNLRSVERDKPVVLNALKLCDRSGEPVAPDALRAGRPYRVRADLEAFAELDAPFFRLALVLDKHWEDGEPLFVFGTNNYRHGVYPRRLIGRLSVTFELPRLDILPGKYDLQFDARDNEIPSAALLVRHRQEIHVVAPSGPPTGFAGVPLRGGVLDPRLARSGPALRAAAVGQRAVLAARGLRGRLAEALPFRGQVLPSSKEQRYLEETLMRLKRALDELEQARYGLDDLKVKVNHLERQVAMLSGDDDRLSSGTG